MNHSCHKVDQYSGYPRRDRYGRCPEYTNRVCGKDHCRKADYCLALKANQDLTYEQVRGFFELGTHAINSTSLRDRPKRKITKRKLAYFRAVCCPKKFGISGSVSKKAPSWRPSPTPSGRVQVRFLSRKCAITSPL